MSLVAIDDRTRGIAAAIGCISIVGVGLSLTIPLLSLELERRGASGIFIGAQTAVQAGASILVAFFVPRLIRAFGPRVLLLGAILLATVVVLTIPLIPNVWLWFPLRFVLGAALTILFIVSEYWITGVAEEKQRGFVMGVYATVLSIGFAAGPAILATLGSTGYAPYLAGAVIFLLGLAPVALGAGTAPTHAEDGPSVPLLAIVAAGPTAVLAAFAFGAIESANFSFLAIWGARSGFSEREAALLLTIAFLGNVACQIPLGLLADRMDKRTLLLAIALIGVVGALAAPALVGAGYVLHFVIFLWGGLIAGLYTVGLSLLAERFDGPKLAAANAAFVMNYSLGMLIGSPIAGAGLEVWNPHGFMIVLAVIAALYAGLVATRMAARG